MAPKPRTSTPSTSIPRSMAANSSTNPAARSDAMPPLRDRPERGADAGGDVLDPLGAGWRGRRGREHRARGGDDSRVERGAEPAEEREQLARQVDGIHRVVAFGGLPGELIVLGEPGQPVRPSAGHLGHDADPARGEEALLPGPDRAARVRPGPIELAVGLPHEAEGVVVVAQPHVQAVLLDPTVDPPGAGPLPAEPPSALVHRDL